MLGTIALITVYTVLGVGIVVYGYRRHKREEASRDAVFEATMRSLEEKAKREGTFVVSYFDSKNSTDS